jgi:uncharacterized protein YciI
MTRRRTKRRPNTHLLLHSSAQNLERKVPAHFPAHWARCEEFLAAGTLLAVGTVANAQAHGPIGIFTTAKSAREFAEGDPFVREGLVAGWEIRETSDALQARLRATRPLSLG